MFRSYGISSLVYEAAQPRVELDSGGTLVIDHTEAMTVVDVNSGSFVGEKNMEETALNVNLEAAREIARRVAYIPQTHYPAFNYAVFDMVLMGTTHSMGAFSTPGEKQRRAAEAALGRMGISHLAGRSYMRLSGGEQQMVLIARALAQESPVLMMDEPTASLDYGNQHRVLSCVRSLAREDGYTVVLSTHNPQHALSYADAILALHDGRVLAAGTPQAVLSGDLLRTLYGVDVCMVDTPQGRVVLPVDGPEEGVAP